MPLPVTEVTREPVHTRTIRVQAYARSDGLWDLEAELTDVKSYDFPLKSGGTHPAGAAVHDILLRITIDEDYNVVQAQAAYDAAPYGKQCSAIATAYNKLEGLNLLKRFRQGVKERFSRVDGCTHMSELSQVLPTVAIQAMVSKRRKQQVSEIERTDRQPFHLDGCHALRVNGPIVKEHYPIWYTGNHTHKAD